ncbi:DUF1569 domain-containing protein [Flavobacteriaceae bacterium TP-CH-4]|uniref:DUF1569 domain-containing protein n=1 Tax=Pelagihabitans pacificus TaxID=2696054 RepID=A0A967AQ28_9FLAO|nr:DUF1569 domain-containing protein [Pelagihabitans pacificus]NHF58259.1 DUF1569 domain-containing protein [Pelagihabitans pacificus]
MKSLFDESVYSEVLARIDNLDENSKRQWGKMTVGQMVWHCQFPLAIAVKNKKPKTNGNLLAKLFFKNSLYNDKPFRKNLPTSPALKAREEKDFKVELAKLRQLVIDFHNTRNRKTWNPHPMFGTFTPEQWGQLEYKHLDHHLRQFGV